MMRTLQVIKRRYIAVAAVGLVALAILGVGLNLWLSSSNSRASGAVNLTVGNKGIVATGTLTDIVARASSMAGLPAEIPSDLPAGGYVSTIVVAPGPNGNGVTAGPVLQVYITVPSGGYIVDELKGTIGGMGGATEVASLETAGAKVFIAPGSNGSGYVVVGKNRSFMLTPASPNSAASAKVDFLKMAASLTVD